MYKIMMVMGPIAQESTVNSKPDWVNEVQIEVGFKH